MILFIISALETIRIVFSFIRFVEMAKFCQPPIVVVHFHFNTVVVPSFTGFTGFRGDTFDERGHVSSRVVIHFSLLSAVRRRLMDVFFERIDQKLGIYL